MDRAFDTLWYGQALQASVTAAGGQSASGGLLWPSGRCFTLITKQLICLLPAVVGHQAMGLVIDSRDTDAWGWEAIILVARKYA